MAGDFRPHRAQWLHWRGAGAVAARSKGTQCARQMPDPGSGSPVAGGPCSPAKVPLLLQRSQLALLGKYTHGEASALAGAAALPPPFVGRSCPAPHGHRLGARARRVLVSPGCIDTLPAPVAAQGSLGVHCICTFFPSPRPAPRCAWPRRPPVRPVPRRRRHAQRPCLQPGHLRPWRAPPQSWRRVLPWLRLVPPGAASALDGNGQRQGARSRNEERAGSRVRKV